MGGGLFLTTGELVGVCVGRVEEVKIKEERVGIFASGASIRHLLRDHDLEGTIARSEAVARRADPSRSTTPAASDGHVPVTPTRANPEGRP